MIDDSFRVRYKAFPIAISERHDFSPTNLHNHNEFEVLLIDAGSCNVRVADKKYEVKAGDLIFVNPMEIHGIVVNEDAVYSHRCMCFEPSVVLDNSLFENFKRECISILHVVEGKTHHGNYLKGLFEKIYEQADNVQKTSPIEISAYITLMFACLLKNTLYNTKRVTPKKCDFCSRVINYISCHYNECLTSKMAAEVCFLNHSYFCRKFRENFGINFTEYLNLYRITIAKGLLEENNGSVSKVASMCGFDTPAYFTKCFKRHIGVSPNDYKKGKCSL